MIDKIKRDVFCLKDKKVKFRYNGSRNQIEEFEGVITNCYNFVFVIDVGDINKSFSYSDVLIGVLELNV